MELSKNTLDILKNFSAINTNLYVPKDQNRLATRAETNNVFGFASVEETFPVDVGILNLNRFLSVVSMFPEPEVRFEDEYMLIHGKDNHKQNFKYYYTAKSCLTYPEKKIKFPDAAFSFVLGEDDLEQIQQASRISHLPDLQFDCTGDSVNLRVYDASNKSSNVFTVEIAGEGSSLKPVMKMEKLKLLPGNYEVHITDRLAMLRSKDRELEYYVAMDARKKA